MGHALKEAIEKMGLNPNKFAKLCIKKDGRALTQTAIVDLIAKPEMKPKPETIEAIEKVLSQTCPHCGQYWPNAPKQQARRR